MKTQPHTQTFTSAHCNHMRRTLTCTAIIPASRRSNQDRRSCWFLIAGENPFLFLDSHFIKILAQTVWTNCTAQVLSESWAMDMFSPLSPRQFPQQVMLTDALKQYASANHECKHVENPTLSMNTSAQNELHAQRMAPASPALNYTGPNEHRPKPFYCHRGWLKPPWLRLRSCRRPLLWLCLRSPTGSATCCTYLALPSTVCGVPSCRTTKPTTQSDDMQFTSTTRIVLGGQELLITEPHARDRVNPTRLAIRLKNV